jgi:transcriptional repressor NrdR
MRCPACGADDTRVVDSRVAGAEQEQIRRRRECRVCQTRFTTFERIESHMPRVVKRSGERVAFSEEKLRAGFRLALHKRPVKTDAEEAAVERVKRRLMAFPAREIQSDRIGEWVMEELRQLDQVAYIRFASIYLSFANVQAFRDAIEKLERDLTPEMRRSQLALISEDEDWVGQTATAGLVPDQGGRSR